VPEHQILIPVAVAEEAIEALRARTIYLHRHKQYDEGDFAAACTKLLRARVRAARNSDADPKKT
jgi:hypothetical protein